MERASFFSWEVELEPLATTQAYAAIKDLDPACCIACATFLEGIRRNVFPGALADFLIRAGADVHKPHEVYGAPDAGNIEGWWVLVGRLPLGSWQGAANDAYAELGPGFRCWLTDSVLHSSPVFDGLPLFQLEFSWEDPAVVELARFANAASSGNSAPHN